MNRLLILVFSFITLAGCSSQVSKRAVRVPSLPPQVHAKSNIIVETRKSRTLEIKPQKQVPSLSLPRIEMPRLSLPQYAWPESRAPRPSREFRMPRSESPVESPSWSPDTVWQTPEWNFEPDLPPSEWAQIDPDWTYSLGPPNLKAELQLKPGAKLRPRSPYCMPGHTSQNFVVTSIHDGLPLHPGVW